MHVKLERAVPFLTLAVRACVMMDWAMLRNSLMLARLQSAFHLVEVPAED